VILVLVTLLGALPVYAQVAGRSFAGQGSIAMLENLVAGWKGKLLVLVLLGFAADRLRAHDDAQRRRRGQARDREPVPPRRAGRAPGPRHARDPRRARRRLPAGFKEAIGSPAAAALPYLALNLVVLARGAWEVLSHPELLTQWRSALAAKGDFTLIAAGALLVFPKLALGLSGFETGVTVMPLIDGGAADAGRDPRKHAVPRGRVANTRKLLVAAAAIMSVLLLASSFVTTLLIAPAEYEAGRARGRARDRVPGAPLPRQRLRHRVRPVDDPDPRPRGRLGDGRLLHLVPRYLPRFGMAPRWAVLARPLVLVLFAVDVVVTLVFGADVEAQSGAYATGVLVLILSAALAATLSLWRERRFALSLYCGAVTLVFAYTLVDNCVERPDGLIIGSIFTLLLMLSSAVSRSLRSIEMRVPNAYFADVESWRIGPELRGKKVTWCR
jgi:hypothetical protein